MRKKEKFGMLVRIIFLFLFALFSTVSTVNADSVKSEEGQIEKEITEYIIEMEKVCNTAIYRLD